ncbi:TIGR03620 family F420-dependent LLM class oxidoreductase [Actinoplanes bogorensis]|uniref:TIGR03620 family F420-dependent LLM class oxidoreductase n=1 Tax=Paractinoplanes bogorensis TaxID=1610840 RepID=A0ABS5Z6D6_9ACTN|nr:TIGR03620 family F420-dependent LLM class oxidoreductase [Actinoplanes bogorensis]MBU2670035.1 TIGR03620 family F420-dependent LLM class oxidoreductase [Actinoplanes bogorensis]
MNNLGRYGIWISRNDWPVEAGLIASAAQEIEALGFTSVWIGASPPDDLELPEAILAATESLVVGTSVVDIWHSHGETLAASHIRVSHQFPGRFMLGVGSGHAPTAASVGQNYTKPLTRLRTFLTDKLAHVPASQRMIAALGPKALATARDLTAGALPYLTPPGHTADARKILGPDPLLIPEQKVYLSTDPVEARRVARRRLKSYLSLPNYTNAWRPYGFTDADFAHDGSDRLTDFTVAWGDAPTVRARVDAHLEAGANHVALQVLSAHNGPYLPRDEWRAVAEALALT